MRQPWDNIEVACR